MGAPTIKSLSFDKPSYLPGETVTATLTYTPGASAEMFDVTAKVTVGGVPVEIASTFTVDVPTVTLTDSGNHTWTKVSTTGTVAVFTTTLPTAATSPPPATTTTPQPVATPVFSGNTKEFTWPQAGATTGFRVQADGFSITPAQDKIAVAGNSYKDWSATLNIPSRTTGEVAAYPNVSTWTQIPGPSSFTEAGTPLLLKDITALSASWSHVMPKNPGPGLNGPNYTPLNYQAEAAFDIFVRPPNELTATTDHHEVMLWTTLQTRKYEYLQKFLTLPTIDGVVWQGWAMPTSVQAGKAPKDSTEKWELILIPTTPTTGLPLWRTSGSVTLLAIFDALIAETWFSTTDALSFVQYGFEVNTTRGKTLTFGVTDYSLTLVPAS